MKSIVLACLLTLFSSAVLSIELKPVADGFVTPPLKLTDLQGKAHDLADYKGQVVLLQFWATYCPPCRKEMPSMNRLMKKMEGTPFTILAVDMGESKQEVEKFIKEVGAEFTVLLDEAGDSVGAWKVFAAPSNFIIAPDGKAKYTLFGGVEWDSDEMVAALKGRAK